MKRLFFAVLVGLLSVQVYALNAEPSVPPVVVKFDKYDFKLYSADVKGSQVFNHYYAKPKPYTEHKLFMSYNSRPQDVDHAYEWDSLRVEEGCWVNEKEVFNDEIRWWCVRPAKSDSSFGYVQLIRYTPTHYANFWFVFDLPTLKAMYNDGSAYKLFAALKAWVFPSPVVMHGSNWEVDENWQPEAAQSSDSEPSESPSTDSGGGDSGKDSSIFFNAFW